MRIPFHTHQFKKDFKQAMRRGWNVEKLEAVMQDLIDEKPLSPLRRDHALVGEWEGARDCHILSDWLLIYRIEPLQADDAAPDSPREIVRFLRTGTHADIFE